MSHARSLAGITEDATYDLIVARHARQAWQQRFRACPTHPDDVQQVAGATMRGPALHAIRPPIPEFTIFGGMVVDRTDINDLLGLSKSVRSFLHAAKILANYGRDRLAGSKRGSRLVMGNALIGRLLASLLDRGADILRVTEITGFTQDAGGVSGVIPESTGTSIIPPRRRATQVTACALEKRLAGRCGRTSRMLAPGRP